MSDYEDDITSEVPGATEAGLTIKLVEDTDVEDPRNYDMSAKFLLFERDRRGEADLSDFSFSGPEDFSGWDDFRTAMEVEVPGIVILPVYRYSHSGTIYSTSPFSCPWDSGQVGFVYATPDMLTEWGSQDLPRETIEEGLRGDVETFSQWQANDTWGVVIEEDGEELDACYGYIGRKWAIESAREMAEPEIRERAIISIS